MATMTTRDALARDLLAESANYNISIVRASTCPQFAMATLDQYDFRKIRRSPPPKKVKQEAKPAVASQPGIFKASGT